MKKNRCKSTGKDRSLANLRPRWKRGESGNLRGRPKNEQCYAVIARDMLAANEIRITLSIPGRKAKDIKLNCNESFRHAIVAAMIQEAISGNVQAARELADRSDGKVTDSLALVNDSPREVIFREVRVGGVKADVPPMVRTITREPKP